MRVAIAHYHLRRGGVTRVIEQSMEALLARGIDVVVLAEECSGLKQELEHRFVAVPQLAYQGEQCLGESDELEAALRAAARRYFGDPPDIWHLHNHHLGKNTAYTQAVASMARAGERLLLHIHDFPEDGRPANYRGLRQDLGDDSAGLRQTLYPIGERVRYGVLNRRDHAVLAGAGIPEPYLHLLPNPVTGEELATKEPLKGLNYESLTLYPTRAIRRKNLGELLLWASIAAAGHLYGCTLAPDNPVARPVYQRWVDRAAEWDLPIAFELGNRPNQSFSELLSAADRLITTSVAEGFGLAFLEPWLFGRPLVGRNLPDITRDFVDEGLELNHLYTAVKVPVDWLNVPELRNTLEQTLASMFEQYACPLPKEHVEATWGALVSDGLIDFGCLLERDQETVISRIRADGGAKEGLVLDGDGVLGSPSVGRNQDVVRKAFGRDRYGERLEGCYQGLCEAAGGDIEFADPQRVLSQFLSPKQFNFLRA